MEENSDIKGPATRRSLRLSIDSDIVSSPATPTKKKAAARVAAKPLLDNIKEDTPVSSPKPTRRRSTARDLDDDKPVTPSRRSTRIRSNTSLVLESALQSVADSPRAKRAAARRNSLAGSDSEATLTPVKTTRRTRKDSTSSIDNNELVATKPVIEETIAEEPETQTETLSPNNESPSRKSPRLARRSKKSGEFPTDGDKNVTPKQSSKELNNSKSDKGKNKRGKQSKTPEVKKLYEDEIPKILVTPETSTITSSKAQADSTNDTSKRQRTKSWTTISNDRVDSTKINRSLNITESGNGTGDFFDKDAKQVASIELLQDVAPTNIQCEIYFEDSNSNGDVKKTEQVKEGSNDQMLSEETNSQMGKPSIFDIIVKPDNLYYEPMDIDETILETKPDANDTKDFKESVLNISEVKATDSDSQSIFSNINNSLNKSKNRKSSLSKSINDNNDQSHSKNNLSLNDSANDSVNNSLNKSKTRKTSNSKSLNEIIEKLASKDNVGQEESNNDNTNNSINKSKNRKSSLSKSINESIDQLTSNDNAIEDNIGNEELLNNSKNNSINKSKNRKSSLSKSINESIDKLTSEDNTEQKESGNDANTSLNKSKNRKSSLSKTINECIDQLASDDNTKESHNENTNISLNKSKNRKSSLSKTVNESIDQIAADDNIEKEESHNKSLNKSKNRKSSLSKTINECIDNLASDDNSKESHNENTNTSLNKSKNRKSSLSKTVNESIDQIAAEDNIEKEESHNKSLNKSKNRKSSLSKTMNESIDKLASEDNVKDSHNENTNISLNKSKNRKSSLSKSVNESTNQMASGDNIEKEESQNKSLNKSKNRKSSLSKSINETIDKLNSEDNNGKKKSDNDTLNNSKNRKTSLSKSGNESSLNQSKSKKNASLPVQDLKQKTNETSSFKASDETNFGEYTDNKTFNNAKSNISFDETDSNLSTSKKSKKNSLSNSKTINKSANENKSTLILSRVDDSTNDNSMNKSRKAALNITAMIDHHKKQNLSEIQDNTPLRNKNVKGLGLQTSTPVVGTQKGSKSKKPEVSEIEESSTDSDTDASDAESESDDDVDSSNPIEKSMFFDDEAGDAGDDYESGDSNEEEDASEEEEEEDDDDDDDEDSNEESSDSDNDISLKPINQVHVDENVSVSRLENATSDPLNEINDDNEDDSASLCSENQEIVKEYDSILDNLNKSNSKKIKNLSLNVDKKAAKGNILIDQLNLTQTKNTKANKNKVIDENKSLNKEKADDSKLKVIKAPTDDKDSDSSSMDIHLLYSDSNSGDGLNDKDSQDYIPLKRSFGATNLHDEPEITSVSNENSKKLDTSNKETNKLDISAGRVSQEKENQNSTTSTKKNKKQSKSTLPTPSKVNEDKTVDVTVSGRASSDNHVFTTVSEKGKKRKRVSEPQDDIDNTKEQPIEERANTKKSKRNTSIVEEPQPRRSKRKATEDNDVGNNDKKPKILKENRVDNIPIPRLAPAILQQLEGTRATNSASGKKLKVVATSSFVIEETVKRRVKPSQYLEQSIHLDSDSPDKTLPKKRAPVPKVLPFVPTAVTSSQGFTTRFQISVLPKEIMFTAQSSNSNNFKNDYLFGKNIKRMGTYALYKKNRNNKLSKF